MEMRDACAFLKALNPKNLPKWQTFLKYHHLFYGWCGLDANPAKELLNQQQIVFMVDNWLSDPARVKHIIDVLKGNEFSANFTGYERIGLRHELNIYRSTSEIDRQQFRNKKDDGSDENQGDGSFHVFIMLYQKTDPASKQTRDSYEPNRFAIVYQIRDARDAWVQFYIDGDSCPKNVAAIHPCWFMEIIIKMVEELREKTGTQPIYITTHDANSWTSDKFSIECEVAWEFDSLSKNSQGDKISLLELSKTDLGAYPIAQNNNFDRVLELLGMNEEPAIDVLNAIFVNSDQSSAHIRELLDMRVEIPPFIFEKVDCSFSGHLFEALRTLNQNEEIAATVLEGVRKDPHDSHYLAEELLTRDLEVPDILIRGFLDKLTPGELDEFVKSWCTKPVSMQNLAFELLNIGIKNRDDIRRIVEATKIDDQYLWFRTPKVFEI